jgi:ectoine hydroxylase-related dioxygenase (phytanoyl-CoA dioxygenase family)
VRELENTMSDSSHTIKTPLSHVRGDTSVDQILNFVEADGGVIIEGFLTHKQVARLNAEVDPALRALDPGGKNTDPSAAEFHGSNTKRLTNLISLSRTFREEVADHDLAHALAERVFREEAGDYWMTGAMIIEIGPGNPAQMLHRDQINFPFTTKLGKHAPMTLVSFLIALVDVTEENGATRFIPASNHWDDFEDTGTPEMTIAAEMKAGDALCFIGQVVHGGGANVTNDQFRRVLTMPFQPAYLTPEEAYPHLIDLELARQLSPRVQKSCGFRTMYPVGSPGTWYHNMAPIEEYLGLV